MADLSAFEKDENLKVFRSDSNLDSLIIYKVDELEMLPVADTDLPF